MVTAMTFVVKDNFVITGRGIVVTGLSDGLIETGDTYRLEDGTEFTIRGIERFGTMLGKPPKEGEQIGVLLGAIDRDLVPADTVLYRRQPSITCPRCTRTSYNPGDIKQGYCGYCKWWTSDSQLGQPAVIAQAEAEGAITPMPKKERWIRLHPYNREVIIGGRRIPYAPAYGWGRRRRG